MSRTTWSLALVVTLYIGPFAFCTEPVADPQADELVRLKQRIAVLEAELAKAKQASSGGAFGSFELLPDLASGKLPESQAERLSQAEVPDIKTAERLALQTYFKARGGFGTNQTLRASSLFPIAAAIKDFADPEDLIWEVRIEGFLGTAGVHQVIWINATDGNVRPLMPIPNVPRLEDR